jgi:hypothetical protein
VKKNYILIVLSLLLSLFIYLFYRTEKTVINDLFVSIVSCDNFVDWRRTVTGVLPLHEIIIYSLPEGLWVFSITLTSKFLFLKVGRYEIQLLFLPLLFSIGLELFQLFHFTNGRFDFWDIGISILFWTAANYVTKVENTKQNILEPFTINSGICVLSYLIVYLAHVWEY